MFKLIRFDFSLILSSMIWRIFYIAFIILFAAMIPFDTHRAIRNASELILGPTIFFTCNILTFLTFAAPLSKNHVSKIGGNYTKIVFSLPIKKQVILNSKYLALMIYSLLIASYIIFLSSVTFLIMGRMPTLVFLQRLVVPVFSSILFFGSLYLASFFVTNKHTIISTVIYFISMTLFMIFFSKEEMTTMTYSWQLLLFSCLFCCASYITSTLLYRYRSY